MANARRQPSGMWLGRYRGPDGKARSKSFDRKADALRWAQDEERRVRVQDWSDPSRARRLLAEQAGEWLGHLTVKPKTRTGYESLLRTVVLPRWGRTRLDQITLAGVRQWLTATEGVSGRTLSTSRRKAAYGVLAMVLDSAVEDGRLVKNPVRPVIRGRRSSPLPRAAAAKGKRYLSFQEVSALAEACADYGTLVLVLACCGLRWGEAAALQVKHVDLLRRRLLIERSLSDDNGRLTFETTKTHQTRTVPLPPFLLPQIEVAMQGKGREDLLFTSPQGSELRLGNWRQRVFDKAVKQTGLTGLTPHGLRHTAASLAVQSGANVKVVQAMLGHKDAAMTLNVYADLFDRDLDEVAERMDAAYRARGAAASVVPLRVSGTEA